VRWAVYSYNYYCSTFSWYSVYSCGGTVRPREHGSLALPRVDAPAFDSSTLYGFTTIGGCGCGHVDRRRTEKLDIKNSKTCHSSLIWKKDVISSRSTVPRHVIRAWCRYYAVGRCPSHSCVACNYPNGYRYIIQLISPSGSPIMAVVFCFLAFSPKNVYTFPRVTTKFGVLTHMGDAFVSGWATPTIPDSDWGCFRGCAISSSLGAPFWMYHK